MLRRIKKFIRLSRTVGPLFAIRESRNYVIKAGRKFANQFPTKLQSARLGLQRRINPTGTARRFVSTSMVHSQSAVHKMLQIDGVNSATAKKTAVWTFFATRDAILRQVLIENPAYRQPIMREYDALAAGRGDKTIAKMLSEDPILLADCLGALCAYGQVDVLAGSSALFDDELSSAQQGAINAHGFRIGKKPSETTKPKKLLIVSGEVEAFQLRQAIKGAETASIFHLDDLYGNFVIPQEVVEKSEAKLEVVFPRSRLGRFTEKYIETHLKTAKIASSFVTWMHEKLPQSIVFDESFSAVQSVTIADGFFFDSLVTVAMADFVHSGVYDEVVFLSGKDQLKAKIVPRLSAIDLADAPPLTFISTDRSLDKRQDFVAAIDANGPRYEQLSAVTRLTAPTVEEIERQIAHSAKLYTPPFVEAKGAWNLFLTASSPAYNPSVARYLSALGDGGKIVVHANNRSFASIFSEIDNIGENEAEAIFDNTEFKSTFIPRSSTKHKLQLRIVQLACEYAQEARDLPAWLINSFLMSIERGALTELIIRCHATARFFDKQRAAGKLPSKIYVTNYRATTVNYICDIARLHAIPSVALEPHGLDANYSRYLKIRSDFYCVASSYFHQVSEHGYDIPSDRTFVIGTPRINHWSISQASTASKRNSKKQADNFRIGFFSQPSKWDSIEPIFAELIRAAKMASAEIQIKLHPEESKSRTSRFQTLAKTLDAEDNVTIVKDILASEFSAGVDLCATIYSAAAIDAAMQDTPVLCIGPASGHLPIRQDKIVNAPYASNADEILKVIEKVKHGAYDHYDSLRAKEPWFYQGFEKYLADVDQKIDAMPSAVKIRSTATIPHSMFLEPPHPIFDI